MVPKTMQGWRPTSFGLPPFFARWVVVGQLPPADHRGRRHRHLVRRHPEPMGQVPARELVISLIGRWPQQARRVHRLVALVSRPDQVVELQDLGDAQLGGLEVHALDLHDDVKDRVRALLDTSAIRPRLGLIPAPRRVLVRVIGIRAADVRRAVLPGDP